MVHMARDLPECTQIHRKVTRGIQFINKFDQNRLESKLLTLSRNFDQKTRILSHFGPEMMVHMSREVTECNEIYIEDAKDIL